MYVYVEFMPHALSRLCDCCLVTLLIVVYIFVRINAFLSMQYRNVSETINAALTVVYCVSAYLQIAGICMVDRLL